ncbi:MAG: hypothetical protein ACE5NA_11255 [Nitrospiraceae bacterium]
MVIQRRSLHRSRQKLRIGLVATFATVLLLASLPGLVSAGAMLEVADLISHPDFYNKQMVAVIGKVTDLRRATNKKGEAFYGFLLEGTQGKVKVIGRGRSAVADGEQVIVEGVFNRIRRSGRAVVYNEIKATGIRSLDRFNPDLVG